MGDVLLGDYGTSGPQIKLVQFESLVPMKLFESKLTVPLP